ncbi:uncharacterized protein [Cherax quadricarinatus]|uniref:uncharacterized protein n=1 Tax=Cherax quadricarinatus TaxID=27406 RepID=UPI00387E923C
MVARYQDVIKTVNPGVTVRLHDVSRFYTWIKVPNVPFEADESDLRNVFVRYGTVHMATLGRWRDGPLVGMPEGSFSLKMSLKHPIPSYVVMEDFRTQVYVTYSGQRRTCRLCGMYDHMAAQCPTRRGKTMEVRRIDVTKEQWSYASATQQHTLASKPWSEEVEGEIEESPVCLTLPGAVEDVGVVSATTEEDFVYTQDDMEHSIQEALNVLLDASTFEGIQGGLGDVSVQEKDGASTRHIAEHQVVVVEVHRNNSSEDEMDTDRSSRKRAAVIPDCEDVLTPGQRSGNKAWCDETHRDTGKSKCVQHVKENDTGEGEGRSGDICKGTKVVKLRQSSSYTTIIVISDDPAFLSAFVERSLKGRLLVWSTRLLAVTRLPLSQLQLLYTAFSKMNAMLLIINGKPAIIRCKIYIHLPYSSRETQPLQVASWTSRWGLIHTSNLTLFPDKFSKFQHGPHLLAASDGNSLHKMTVTNDPEAPGVSRIRFTGPMAHMMDYLAEALNFSYTIVRPPDGFWGANFGNGSWSGMVGMVMREEVQLAVGPFMLSGERSQVVDFTVPVMIDYWRIIGARGHPEVDPWGFVFPLAPLVWAFILAALIMLVAAVFLMYSSFSISTHRKGIWLQATFNYVRILLQQDITVPSYWWWERMVLMVWMMGTLVLTRSYSGNLMALLAVRHISEPYQSRRQVLDDPSVTMIWLKGSGLEGYLKSFQSGIYWEMAKAEKAGRLIWRTQSQFPGDVNTLVRRGHHVLMDAGVGISAQIAQDFSRTGRCSFYSSREGFLPLIFVMFSSQNNPIIPAFNKRMRDLTEAGLFLHWVKTSEPNYTMCVDAPTKITVITALSIRNIWGMFIILVFGYTVGLLAFLLELLSLCRKHI